MAKRKYTREFKVSAAKLVNEQGYTVIWLPSCYNPSFFAPFKNYYIDTTDQELR